ncbi:MAG: MATE family efflux transporter [Candidatus Bathyarchaeia archaeon]|nr:MATE family efflux transporter [Candidatus Bathyarchaeota archaeon]
MAEELGSLLESPDLSKYRDRIVNGSTVSTFFWLGVPPMLNQLVLIAYNVADTYWLSRYDELCVSIPRQVFPVLMLFQALVMATNAACLSIVSQYIGAKAYKNASKEASRFFTAACISGVSLNIILLSFREQIFSWLIFTPPEIFEEVMAFSAVTAFDVLFMSIAFTFTTLFQSLGDTRRPATINIVCVAVNIALDPFLVLGIGPFPRLGVVGAALTDVMGKILSIIGQVFILWKSYPMLRLRLTRDLNFEWTKLVLKIGLPILSFGTMNGVAFLLQQRLINMLGIIVATAFSIGFVIMNAVDGMLFGLCQATAIMVGQSLGAANPKRAREVALKTTVIVFILVAIGATFVYPLRMSIISVFASNQNIIEETEQFLSIVLPLLPFFGICINVMSVGRGSGHTMVPTTIEIVRIWTLRIALGYFLTFIVGMGSLGIWLPLSLSNAVGGTALAIWAKYGKWDKAIIKTT